MATQTRQRAARTAARSPKANGDGAVVSAADLQPLLEALRASARGEVGVRLDTRKRGVVGQLGKAFNNLAQTRERTTDEMVRVATVIGREGRLTDRADTRGAKGTWKVSLDVRQHDDRRPLAPDPRGRARDRRGRRGRSEPEDAAEDRGPPGQGRVPAHRHDGQLDGRPALVVRRRGDARRARGRHRGQARRPGAR